MSGDDRSKKLAEPGGFRDVHQLCRLDRLVGETSRREASRR
jgi:hypothetical protein